jgi:DNA-binding NtrC family response regulator
MPVIDALQQFGLNGPVSLREARRQFERSYILAVLEQNHWRVGATARALGLQRPNLYRKARQLSIQLKPTAEVEPVAQPQVFTASPR